MSMASRSASLAALVRAVGGDLYAGGRRALVPAPGHSAQDRSVSLLLEGDRVVAHSFGGAAWQEILDDLRDRGWIDAENRLLCGGAPAPRRTSVPDLTRAERIAAARRLWEAAGRVTPECPAGLYIAARGIHLQVAAAGALRAHAAVPAAAYRDRGVQRPALLAGVRDPEGELCAVEITYLDAQGRRSALARPPRKVVGVLPAGCAVRLARRAAVMAVGEGVFSALSAMQRFGLPAWALLSTSNLRRWRAPDGVRRVMVAGDRGPDGERSAALLVARLRSAGCAAAVALPPAGYGDWNDLDQEAVEEGRDEAPGP